MWDFCLGIEYTSIYAGTDSNPTYGYGEQFAHLAQRPQQKFLNYFYFFLALVGLLFCCFFFSKVMSWTNFIIPAKDGEYAPQLRNYNAATEFYLRKFYFNLFYLLLSRFSVRFLYLFFREFFAFTLLSFMNFNEGFLAARLLCHNQRKQTA